MAHHAKWTKRTVDEVLEARAVFESAWADGVITSEEAERIRRELACAAYVAEVAELADTLCDEWKRTGGVTPYLAKRARQLGLRLAALEETCHEC